MRQILWRRKDPEGRSVSRPGFPRPQPAPLRRGPAEVDEDDQTCVYHNLHLSCKGTYLQKGQRTEQGGLQTCNRTARSLEPVPWAVGYRCCPEARLSCRVPGANTCDIEHQPLLDAPRLARAVNQAVLLPLLPKDAHVTLMWPISLSLGFAMDTGGRDSFSSLSLEL